MGKLGAIGCEGQLNTSVLHIRYNTKSLEYVSHSLNHIKLNTFSKIMDIINVALLLGVLVVESKLSPITVNGQNISAFISTFLAAQMMLDLLGNKPRQYFLSPTSTLQKTSIAVRLSLKHARSIAFDTFDGINT